MALKLAIKARLDSQIQTLGEGVILADPTHGSESGYPFRVDLRGKYQVICYADENLDCDLLEGWQENTNP